MTFKLPAMPASREKRNWKNSPYILRSSATASTPDPPTSIDPVRFRYMSWNLMKLSVYRLTQQTTHAPTQNLQSNLSVYVNAITSHKLDIFSIIEVTCGTGEQAIQQIVSHLTDYSYIKNQTPTTDQTNKEEKSKGEFNAIIYKCKNSDGSKRLDGDNTKVRNLDKVNTIIKELNSSKPGRDNTPVLTIGNEIYVKRQYTFKNRVPVMFKLQLFPSDKTVQIITWHAPAPDDMDGKELKTLAVSINNLVVGNDEQDMEYIDTAQPVIISGDFNINTDSEKKTEWDQYLYKAGASATQAANNFIKDFVGLINGLKTTLVKKDPLNRLQKNKSFNPVLEAKFDDLLANAYDNILFNKSQLKLSPDKIKSISNPLFIKNHLIDYIWGNTITFSYQPAGYYTTQLIIDDANRISDHLAVIAEFEIP
jgi:hypothetical protein